MRDRLRQPTPYLILLLLAFAAGLRLWRLDELPPGLYHDEAYYGLDALTLLHGGEFPRFYEGWELYRVDAYATTPPRPTRWPVFFEGNYGREPLHVYLMALSIGAFGPTPFAIRFVPAIAGTLAVFTTYLAAAALLPRRYQPGAPLMAAAALAIFFPTVLFSRFGIRGILLLPVASLCVHAFWRAVALRRDGAASSLYWFVLAGLWLGLTIYTYAAGRLFPLLFLVFVPVWLGRERMRWRDHLPGLGLMAGASLLVAAPLLLFYLRYPFYLSFRAAFVANRGEGAVPGKAWLTWLNNVGRVALGLVWRGEEHLRHNLPGRPFLDPIQAGLALLGSGAAAASWRRSPGENRGRWLFLGLWLIFMLLPSILSGDAPHFGRLIGAAVPLALFAGLGAEAARQALQVRLRWPFVASTVVLLALLAVSAALTMRDYFVRYANHPGLPTAFYEEDWLLGQYAARQEADLYLSPTREEMATIYFALGDPDRLRSFESPAGALPLGRPGRETLYLLAQPDPALAGVLAARRPEATVEATVAGVTPVRARTPAAELAPSETWAGAIGLAGWEAARVQEGLAVTLTWQALADMQLDYTVYVHLSDEQGNLVAQADRPPQGYPTSDWRVQEQVEDRYLIPIPESPPPGNYRLSTGFYYLPTMELLGAPIMLDESLALP